MGRVQGPAAQERQWLHGVASLPGVHSEDTEGGGVSGYLRHRPRLWSRCQEHRVLHDITTQAGQGCALLQQGSR